MLMCDDVLYSPCPIFFSFKRIDRRILRVHGGRIGVASRGQVDGVWPPLFHTPPANTRLPVGRVVYHVYQALPCPGPIFTPRRLIGGYAPRTNVRSVIGARTSSFTVVDQRRHLTRSG